MTRVLPRAAAGMDGQIQPGDELVKVGWQVVQGKSVAEVYGLLHGTVGSKIALIINKGKGSDGKRDEEADLTVRLLRCAPNGSTAAGK